MKIKSVKLVTFSPTGASKKVAESIANAIKAPFEYVDLTSPRARTQKFEEFTDELAIITSPVYIGRVPYEVAVRLRGLKANNTPAVIVVSYGNRAYEDALIELSDIASEVGFKPIAVGAFIGEHSWSTKETPVAEGRPDKDDLVKAENFGKKVKAKLEKADTIEDISVITGFGENPYIKSIGGRRSRYEAAGLMSPSTNEELCTKCGTCVGVCPTAAITIEDIVSNPSPMASLNKTIVSTDANTCIWCAACAKSCPTGARVRRPTMLAISGRLNGRLSERKEPETYL